ncbi:hypothetical protein CEXT_491941 [Caerostris extrusa]|uniref:Secreted protein n=1 Tax=Caerostris extrusa TaxID=172846 RepID=A0AAV4SPK6_CAEEX|nr:hypothetical protein CEXT_491941 [Caerostris extrusa]
MSSLWTLEIATLLGMSWRYVCLSKPPHTQKLFPLYEFLSRMLYDVLNEENSYPMICRHTDILECLLQTLSLVVLYEWHANSWSPCV